MPKLILRCNYPQRPTIENITEFTTQHCYGTGGCKFDGYYIETAITRRNNIENYKIVKSLG